jgi:MYXO-CTERM domain-containing protein
MQQGCVRIKRRSELQLLLSCIYSYDGRMSDRQLRVGQVGAFLVALLAVGPAYAVCGDGVWEADEPCDDGNNVANDACNRCRLSCERIDVALTIHTCGHGARGPFVSAAAQSYPGAVHSEVSESHTYFTLTMSGESGQNRSAALYGPGVDGLYAFYLKEPYPFAVVSPAGDGLPLLFEHGVSCAGAGAGSLTLVRVYELRSQDTYTLAFGPTEGATVSFAGELLEDLRGRRPSPRFWNRDGDEYGGALAGLGACDYGEHTVLDVPGDCDDSDANVQPGAPEVCDGVDNDCSAGDDAGAEGLCGADDAGTACVDAGTAIRCGCRVDDDCEGEATCDAVVQRCVAPSGSGGASFGEGGHGLAGDVAGAPSGAGRSGSSVAGSSQSAGPGAGGEPSESGRGDERASDGGCSYGSRRGPPSAGLALFAAVALGLLRRRQCPIRRELR